MQENILYLRRIIVRYKSIFIAAIFISSLIFGSFIGTVEAADEDIAQQYAPIFYFEQEETFFPVDVSYHIDNSNLYLIGDEQPIDTAPSAESISVNTSDGYYLDNQKGAIDDDGIINDYKSSKMGSYTVYAHVVDTGGLTIIQYWMFYAFNLGTMNQHEGDWEMVQVVLSDDTPTQVMYSQHHSGQKATWSQVEKSGNHIKVYVSRGSHANYLRSYSGVVGIANDIVGENGKRLTSSDYDLVMMESQPWLDFAGRWGWVGTTEEDAQVASLLGQSGPPGPMFRENGDMWDDPIGWGNNLMQADNNIFLLEMILYNFVTIFIVISIVTVCVLLFRIYRRHKKTGLGPRIISMFYIDGLNLKSIGNILCIVGIIIAFISLFNPWYTVSTDIQVTGFETEGMADMLTIDGINGIQIQVPGLTGPMPMGSFMVPFSLLIGISLVFLIIASVGIVHSKKLGKKYLARGARLMVPVLLIIIVIMSLGMIPFESMVDTGDAAVDISGIIGAISSSPSGGQQIMTIPEVNEQIELQWGFGLGGILLLISGVILVISGGLEVFANTEFYAVKTEGVTKTKKTKKERKKNLEENPVEEILKEKEEAVEKPKEEKKEKNIESPKPEDFEEKNKNNFI